MCAPLIAALRDAGHVLGVALSDRNADVFAPQTFATRHILTRIPWPRHGSTPETSERARAEIAAAHYDAALVASEEPEAYELARPATRRIGFGTGWSKPLKSWWVSRRLTTTLHRFATAHGERAHEAEIMFRLGAGLHAERAPTRDAARLRPLILEHAVPERRHVVLQLGVKWQAMGVDPVSLRAIVAMLAERGAQLLVSPAERAAAEAVAGPHAYVACETVAAWKRCVDLARAVVTPDTGTAHLAGMLGIPVIECFPDAGAAAQIARWHPWAAPYVALRARELRGGDGVRRIEGAVDAY
ncbi:MAG: glycosyltransferase family 9 protein [Candidatus Velthaea sp.]